MTTSTNGRRITTHEATVKTAAVEVKTLTISGKQVTLAVFRQLQSGVLIDWETGALRGIPWGQVNYHPICLDTHYHEQSDLRWWDHLHVVWQEGEELHQDIIPARPQYDADTAAEREKRQAFMLRWDTTYLSLKALDQLFIAV